MLQSLVQVPTDSRSGHISGVVVFRFASLAVRWTVGHRICRKACCSSPTVLPLTSTMRMLSFPWSIFALSGESSTPTPEFLFAWRPLLSMGWRSRIEWCRSLKTIWSSVLIALLADSILGLTTEKSVEARRVVLAVGITHFEHIPDCLAGMPPEFLSHSSCHHKLEPFQGRSVVVVGGGASALDLAGLLHDAGADVQLVARKTELKFHSQPTGMPRSAWQRFRHPQSGLGPGLRSRFFANSPVAFHYLPERLRLEAVARTLGPSGGWFIKEKVVGKLPLLLGCTPQRSEIRGGKVHLHLRSVDGTEREVVTQHVIAATGYKVDLERLKFLSPRCTLKA